MTLPCKCPAPTPTPYQTLLLTTSTAIVSKYIHIPRETTSAYYTSYRYWLPFISTSPGSTPAIVPTSYKECEGSNYLVGEMN
ncbi:uncharacterized protein LAJ45_05066 [Morchella importuna]|uniref:uncharacterized protein n=1 Tax=Morchella importuna TaxID=1174673 RepID=UPI001E8CA3B0|nr:uncharacterized protein LAJ45_05066 [Morchella importuna]KAH8150884.1 hypothetical protein LAJ45_05066 [Morchella importuna]